jgi:hypothetical protein
MYLCFPAKSHLVDCNGRAIPDAGFNEKGKNRINRCEINRLGTWDFATPILNGLSMKPVCCPDRDKREKLLSCSGQAANA